MAPEATRGLSPVVFDQFVRVSSGAASEKITYQYPA